MKRPYRLWILLGATLGCDPLVSVQLITGTLVSSESPGSIVARRGGQLVALGRVQSDGRFALAVPLTATVSFTWFDGLEHVPLMGGSEIQICDLEAPADLGRLQVGRFPQCLSGRTVPSSCLPFLGAVCLAFEARFELCAIEQQICAEYLERTMDNDFSCEGFPTHVECEQACECRREAVDIRLRCLSECPVQYLEQVSPCSDFEFEMQRVVYPESSVGIASALDCSSNRRLELRSFVIVNHGPPPSSRFDP